MNLPSHSKLPSRKVFQFPQSDLSIQEKDSDYSIIGPNGTYEILGPEEYHPFCNQNEFLFANYNNEYDKEVNIKVILYLRDQLKATVERLEIPRVELWIKHWRSTLGIIINPEPLKGLICGPTNQEGAWAVARPFQMENAMQEKSDMGRIMQITNPSTRDLQCTYPSNKVNPWTPKRRFPEEAYQTGGVFESSEIESNFITAGIFKRKIDNQYQIEHLNELSENQRLFCLAPLPHANRPLFYEWRPEAYQLVDGRLIEDGHALKRYYELIEIEVIQENEEKKLVTKNGQQYEKLLNNTIYTPNFS